MISDQHYIVTGGAGGIGLATARLLKQLGAYVTLWDVDAGALRAASRELDAPASVLDVRDDEAVQYALAQAAAAFNGVDGVIHCAGLGAAGCFDTLPLDQQHITAEVNLIGTLNVAYAALPHLKTSSGHLIVLVSEAGFYGTPELAVYGATQAAIINFVQALRLEQPELSVRLVATGFVNTALYQQHLRESALAQSRRTVQEPEAVAETILRALVKRRGTLFASWRVRWWRRLSRWLGARWVRYWWQRGQQQAHTPQKHKSRT